MDTNNIKVSVILPVYNSENYIEACLNSLLNQTLKDIEIIAINDCSTDSSGCICDRYAKNDSRMHVLHNGENTGEALSRNKGIEVARGEYIAFADSDDYVDLDFYEKLYCAAQSNDADIAKAQRLKVFPDGHMESQEKLNKKIKQGLKNGIPLFALFNYEHTTALFRAKKLLANKTIRYPDITIAPDVVFLLKAAYFMEKIVFVKGTYYYYRQHSQSVSAEKDSAYYDSILECFKLRINFLNEVTISSKDYNFIFYKMSRSVIRYYQGMKHSKKFDAYRSLYVKAFFKTLQQYALIDIDKIESIVAALSLDDATIQRPQSRLQGKGCISALKGLSARLFGK
jgi:glycosyltransferase involved in cell wall biosynthesis